MKTTLRRGPLFFALMAILFAGTAISRADVIIYSVDLNIANGYLQGTITTDGTCSPCALSDITAIDLVMTLNDNVFTATTATDLQTNPGTDLSATLTALEWYPSELDNYQFIIFSDNSGGSNPNAQWGWENFTNIPVTQEYWGYDIPSLGPYADGSASLQLLPGAETVIGSVSTAVPEPPSYFLTLIGLGPLLIVRKQKVAAFR